MPEKYLSETQGKPSIKLYCFTLDTPPETQKAYCEALGET